MNRQVIKSVLYGAAALFGVILLLTVIGAVACLFGAGDSFYCGAFCILGKITLVAVLLVITIQTYRALSSN
jgi:hypothetical protein